MNNLKLAIRKAMTTTAGVGGDFLPIPLANWFIHLVTQKNVFRQLFRIQPMSSKTLDIPKILTGSSVYYEAVEAATEAIETSITTGTVRLTARKFMSQLKASAELLEDSGQNMESIIRQYFAKGLADAEELTMMVGDRSHLATSPTIGGATEVNWYTKDARLAWYGILVLAGDIVGTFGAGNRAANRVDASGATMSSLLIRLMLHNLGKYATNFDDIVLFLNPWSANQLLDDAKLVTMDKYGPKATIVTGEFGKLYGKVSVISSSVLPEGYGVGTHRQNVIIGDRRKIKLLSEDVITYDLKRFVISQRADMQVEYQDALCQIYDLEEASSAS